MLRRLLLLLILTCLMGQSLVRSGASVMFADHEKRMHAVLHFQATPHHHEGHDDGFHCDTSDASSNHALSDAETQSPVLLSAMSLVVLEVVSLPPAGTRYRRHFPPLPNLLERPPKQNF